MTMSPDGTGNDNGQEECSDDTRNTVQNNHSWSGS
jgi:hypothetical protein